MTIESKSQSFLLHSWLFQENGTKPFVSCDIPHKDNYFVFGPLCEQSIKLLEKQVLLNPEIRIFWTTDFGEVEVFSKHSAFFEKAHFFLFQENQFEALPFLASDQAIKKSACCLFFTSGLESYRMQQETLIIHFINLFYLKSEKRGVKKLADHIISNLGHLQNSILVEDLKDKFLNKPLLLLGAGPSLDDLYGFLKKYQDHAFIFAGGTAMALLHKEGIKVDFGATVCPNDDSKDRLYNSMSPDVLFSSLRCHKEVLNQFEGPKVIANMTSGIGFDLLQKLLGFCPIMNRMPDESATVATFIFACADYMGFSPIILAGFDLGYKDKQYSGDIQSDWEQERFLVERRSLASQIQKSSRKIYVYESSLFQPAEPISLEGLRSIFLEKRKEPYVFQKQELSESIKNYLLSIQKSQKVVDSLQDHPLKEVMLEDELAWNEYAKFFT